jgi:GH24 family phage-related lysozyme (muramidase)
MSKFEKRRRRVLGEGRLPFKRAPHNNVVEDQKINELDRLAQYEEFKNAISPKLQERVLKGASVEEMFSEFAAAVGAAMLTRALRDGDFKAMQDVLNRAKGTPVQAKKVEHTYSEMSEEQLDALVESKIQELEDDVEEILN